MDEKAYTQNPVLGEARDAMVKVLHARYSIYDLWEIAQDAIEKAVKETSGRSTEITKKGKSGKAKI